MNNRLSVSKQFSLYSFLFFIIGTTPILNIFSRTPNSVAKNLTILFYISADNDLEFFSRRNIAQIAAVGSNEHVNLIIQLDTKTPGGQKITKRYFVEKNKLIILMNGPGLDSGNPETLIGFARESWEKFPAKNLALILWNHGTGVIDVGKPHNINPSILFSFNPIANLIELDRSIPFLEFAEKMREEPRGVCFDDSTGNYLTNQKLEYALKTICDSVLKGKKLALVGFDACLMSMLEIAALVKNYAHVMVGSQEVEFGTGWNYQTALSPLTHKILNPKELGCQIVASYEKTYAHITNDYTQSALNLSGIQALENNIDHVATILIKFLQLQANKSAQEAIKASRHRLLCTHFEEPSYIDLGHFYKNLLTNIPKFICQNHATTTILQKELKKELVHGLSIINEAVLCNVVGKNLSKATGISVYFPEHTIHASYPRTNFAHTNAWYQFLKIFLHISQ